MSGSTPGPIRSTRRSAPTQRPRQPTPGPRGAPRGAKTSPEEFRQRADAPTGRRGRNQPQNPDATQLYLRPQTKQRLRRLAQLMAAGALAVLSVFALSTRGSDIERPVERSVDLPSSGDHAHTVDSALPADFAGWNRSPALDASPKPFGTVELTAYANPQAPEQIVVMKQRTPQQLLGEYEARSGLSGQQRFGRVSCGLNGASTQCATTIKGGLLVLVSPTSKVSFQELADLATAAYNGLK